jgi:hypothetical protein
MSFARRSIIAMLLAGFGAGCLHHAPPDAVSRQHAIDIAVRQVHFQPFNVEAVKATVSGRPLWRVTIKGRLPGQPPELFETQIVEIDRRTGAVISVSRT